MKKQKVLFWHKLFLFGVLLFINTQLFAQIKGKVTDSDGMPLPGVTVLEKNTQNGVITDINGQFQIKLKNAPEAVLVFSFVGLTTKEILVEGKTIINVVLEDDSRKLEEVVVVAYGTQKKVSVTGAISSVSTKDLKQSPSANFIGTLAGRLPGLVTVQTGGKPGEEGINMYLRGVSTTNGTEPLVLVDGVPRDIITNIDPNEVESVSVLKDASATAVFGVRGANGVILITTKRGSNRTPQLSVSAEYGIQNVTRIPKPLDSWEFATLRRQAFKNDGLPIPAGFSDAAIAKYKSGVDPVMYPNTNWFEMLIKPNAPMNRYNVNVSGGNDRVKYFMNGSYTHQGSTYKSESKEKLGYDPAFKMDRYNFRTNLDIKMNSWIKSTFNLGGYIQSVNESQFTNTNTFSPIVAMYSHTPLTPGPTTLAGYGVPVDEVITTSSNPNTAFGGMNRSGYSNETRSNLNSTLAFNFDLDWITKGLSSKAMVSFDSKSNAIIDGTKNYTRFNFQLVQETDPNDPTQLIDKVTFTPKTPHQLYLLTLKKTSFFSYNINLQWAINYNRNFGKHAVTGMALVQRDNSEAASGNSDILLPYNVLGYAGRVTYGYDNRYLIEGNAGYNGSEQFASGETRFGFFPAASVGWVASNEAFMKNQKIITNLKFRISYGKVGNDKLGNNRFLYLDNTSVAAGGFSPSLGLGKMIKETLIGNPLITWETSYKQNYGIELTLLKDLAFTGDLFFEKRDNILLQRNTVPVLQGLPLNVVPKANVGKVNNKGFELELAYTKFINKDFSFVIRGNYNYNENKVIEFDEPMFDESYAYRYNRTGYSLSQNWGYLIDWNSIGKGYFTSPEEIVSSGLTYDGKQPKPGDFIYKDLNGDKVINDKDKAPIKYGNVPRITYGANISVSYKGLDVSALVQGTAQTSAYYSTWGVMEFTRDGFYTDYHRNAWTKELYEAGGKITYPQLTTSDTGSSSTRENDFFIMDRSYFRLKNAEIGYTLPEKIVKKVGAQKIRCYVNGQNLFIWDNLPIKNFDPEQISSISISHPINQVINIGANVVF